MSYKTTYEPWLNFSAFFLNRLWWNMHKTKRRMGSRAFSYQATLLWNQLPIWVVENGILSALFIYVFFPFVILSLWQHKRWTGMGPRHKTHIVLKHLSRCLYIVSISTSSIWRHPVWFVIETSVYLLHYFPFSNSFSASSCDNFLHSHSHYFKHVDVLFFNRTFWDQTKV